MPDTEDYNLYSYYFELIMCTNNSPISRFIESMNIDYEKWHDGIGYDLEALTEANTEEREEIERILVNRDRRDWRDIEALAILNTPKARSTILHSLLGGNNEVNMAVLRFAPELVSNQLKNRVIIEALKSANFFDGFSLTMDIVGEYHPEEVVRELFNGLIYREGGVAVHFAAMLFYIYGKAETIFDEKHRDFFLKFNTSILSDRKLV
ncbi:MAG: hypothetical protein PVH79_00210, partial [Candidatus Bathyarchaeota archaeon]